MRGSCPEIFPRKALQKASCFRCLRVAARWVLDLQFCALNLYIIKNNWRQNHPWDASQSLSNQEAEESEPHRVLDSPTDDPAVKEILKFMQDDKIGERDDAEPHRLR